MSQAKENQNINLPPQALDAEAAVLGALMLDPHATSTALEIINEFCFYKESHQKIYLAALSLYERSEPVDVLTVSNELEKNGELESVGGTYYLTELVENIPSVANVEHYCKIILDKSLLRRCITVSNEVQQECYEGTNEAQDILDNAEQKFFAISESRSQKDFEHIKPVLYKTMEQIQSFHGKGVTGVLTGFTDLDKLLSGMQPSDLIILAARPSMGKTAFCLNIARNAAMSGTPVAIFSLEMSAHSLAMRMLCSEARVDSHKVRTGKLPETEWQKISASVGRLADAPIFIDDTAGMNILELRSKARRLKSEHNIGLIVVDYLQLLRGVGRVESRQIEISMISQALKNIAKELDIPVLSLSQLSRAVESRGGDRKPLLSDLRESGAIEQDADVVMFIYRPAAYPPVEPELENVAEIIIAKQRNGPTDTVELMFLKDYVQFANKEEFVIDAPPVISNDMF